MEPAASVRPTASAGAPTAKCHKPSVPNANTRVPTVRRGRAAGSDSVRIRATATPASTTGSASDAVPNMARKACRIPSPTGPPAAHHIAAAVTTASATRPSASPSRRCAGSSPRAPPNALTSPPAPRASKGHTPGRLAPRVRRWPLRGLLGPSLETARWTGRCAVDRERDLLAALLRRKPCDRRFIVFVVFPPAACHAAWSWSPGRRSRQPRHAGAHHGHVSRWRPSCSWWSAAWSLP